MKVTNVFLAVSSFSQLAVWSFPKSEIIQTVNASPSRIFLEELHLFISLVFSICENDFNLIKREN